MNFLTRIQAIHFASFFHGYVVDESRPWGERRSIWEVWIEAGMPDGYVRPPVGYTQPSTSYLIPPPEGAAVVVVDRYPMGEDQLAQIDCRVSSCAFYKGSGQCTNPSPALTLNPSQTFTCWSRK